MAKDPNPQQKFRPARWWQRRGPSVAVIVVLLGAMTIGVFGFWSNISGVIPSVGKDLQGDDPWVDLLGVEKVGGFQIAHIPDCATAPIVRIELWNEDSEPYWAVTGPPTAMSSFVVGALPAGWTEVVKYNTPRSGAVLRLMVVRNVKGVAGVRYKAENLRTGYATTGVPPQRFELENFQTGRFCEGEVGTQPETTTTTQGGA
ncbi:MAG: hypothetical protein KDA95_08300 [Acidimicrobiales bacterium]|nr:hypothetical protein [Acidimicrobiales bacterium]